MTDRASLIDSFLAARGWDGAERTALASDASFRRYERLTLGDRGAVLMDAPPAHEDVRPFVAVDRYLAGRGYSVPAILAADVGGHGCRRRGGFHGGGWPRRTAWRKAQ
mgnify:CR=1 FL=1